MVKEHKDEDKETKKSQAASGDLISKISKQAKKKVADDDLVSSGDSGSEADDEGSEDEMEEGEEEIEDFEEDGSEASESEEKPKKKQKKNEKRVIVESSEIDSDDLDDA